MPAIYLFHRRTIVGGDDLQPAAFLTASLRCVQLVCLLGPILAHIHDESSRNGGLFHYIMYDPSDDVSCRHSNLFPTLLTLYAVASVVYSFASIALEWRLAHWSSIGSPTETEPRSSKVRHLLELKLVPFSILLLLVWMSGLSAVAFAPLYNYCVDLTQQNNSEIQREMADDIDKYSVEVFTPLRVHLWWLALAILLVGQLSEVLVSFAFLWHLCKQPMQAHILENPELMEVTLPSHRMIEEMWADRCAAACQCLGSASCFMFGGRELLGQAEFGDVARALADYLDTGGILDVVPSDIVTGFMLLQRIQRQRIYRAREEVLQHVEVAARLEGQSVQDNAGDELMVPLDSLQSTSYLPSSSTTCRVGGRQSSVFRFDPDGTYERRNRALFERHNVDEMSVLEEGTRYAKYALAIYTWVLYLYVHPCSGIPRLFAKSGRLCCRSSKTDRRGESSVIPQLAANLIDQHGRIEGDNLCETNKAALLLTVGLMEADLIYAQLRSGFADTPYAILVDHEWKSIVVSIRGTFSLEDCVTDVLIDPEPLEQLGVDFGFDAKDQYCHGGVLTCVRNVYRDLQRHGILDRLLLGEHARFPEYRLRLVGHSLGASTCTLLSYMLRGKFASIRCVNYSPPGHSLTWNLAVSCHEWCNSFVLDSDLVPRLSFNAMEILRNEILSLIGRIKVPKIEVASRVVSGSGLSNCRFCLDQDPDEHANILEDINEMLYAPTELPESEYQHQLERFQTVQEERRRSRGHLRSLQLYPPGKLVHLVKIGERKSCLHGLAKCLTCCTTNAGSKYQPVWIGNDDLNEIVVSPTMATDHFPNRLCDLLQTVAREYKVKTS